MAIDCPEQRGATFLPHGGPSSADLFCDMTSVSDRETFISAQAPTTSECNWDTLHNLPHNCFAVVLNMLSRLLITTPPTCALSGRLTVPISAPRTPETATTDALHATMSQNRQIIQSLTTLLDCPCSQDEYLLYLMTLVALKVMAQYTAVAAASAPTDNNNPHSLPTPSSPSPTTMPPQPPATPISMWPGLDPESPSSSSSSSPSPPPPPPSSSSLAMVPLGEETQQHLPAATGGCPHRAAAAPAAGARLVLPELQRVQRLVEALCKRLEGVRMRAGGRAAPGSGSSGVGEEDAGLRCCGGLEGPRGVEAALLLSVPTVFQLEEDLRRAGRVLASETLRALGRG
ncbi:6f7e50fe-0588-40ac-84fb-3dc55e73ed6b [Thermothielavioides terrestris]|uniref:Aflatoxin regulatory protein domain-containing protein n=2 Tax=Thermothielavioides terrestris TaxID=2587410 RepID=G2R649_THETT|nr:uncharacterized protein THITE_2116473 [Thermothielavioides terrestris NRRL 8126]AEO67586.1 hypothetical protein THITE_2116473 [Thermothielavioides terrestris NRRL 8126]SPQ25711.1 6f7e50fe-0588-40ac-84fb-3dc55e73ed6b [Thermothielavioides terrestris]